MYSLLSDATKSAATGAVITAGLAGLNKGLKLRLDKIAVDFLSKLKTPIPPINELGKKVSSLIEYISKNPKNAVGVGALVGASLALGYYLIKGSYNKLSNNSAKITSNNSVSWQVADHLKASGYKSGKDYTIDPSVADYIHTKVCLVINASNDELSIISNSVDDNKLNSITKNVIKNLPDRAKYYKNESGLTLSSFPANKLNSQYIANIAEMFINRKYSVFIVEV